MCEKNIAKHQQTFANCGHGAKQTEQNEIRIEEY